MLLAVHKVCDTFSAWCEARPCHDGFTDEQQKLINVLVKFVGDPSMSDGRAAACPVQGRRAWKMATGALDKVLRDAFEFMESIIMSDIHTLDEAEQGTILADMEHLKAQLMRNLQQKLAFWDVLPWSMAGIASPNVLDARAAARRCMQQFDEADGKTGDAVADSTGLHDRLVARVMVGELRRQLEAFANGDIDLCECPELCEIVLPFCFVPIVERIIEAQHAVIHKFCAGRKVSGPYISACLRCPHIKASCEDPAYRLHLESIMPSCRKANLLLTQFDFERHPDIVKLKTSGIKKKRINREQMRCFSDIFYCIDGASQFANHVKVSKEH